MTDSPKYVYVIFSSTQYMIAKCIRAMTNHRYNHVSISLDGNLQTLYSFARRYDPSILSRYGFQPAAFGRVRTSRNYAANHTA